MIDDFKRPRYRPPKASLQPPQKPQTPPEPVAEPTKQPTPESLLPDPDMTIEEPTNTPQQPPKKPKKSRHLWPVGWSKRKKRLATAGLALLVIVLIGGLSYWKFSSKPAAPAKKVSVKKAAPKPTTVASNLSGLQVAPEINQRPVTAVMIENSPDARPQAGLKDASVVFEAIAEGGITRFLALFQDTQPDYIGPIRSSRPYYLDWLLPFDAAYAHVGGSGEALAQIKQLGIKDMDQFSNSGGYNRVSNRYAPHNVYSSTEKLDLLEKQKGYTSSKFTGFVRKAEAKSVTPNAVSIDFAVSGPLYNSHYDYDAASNSYLRNEGGKPHIDERSNAQIAAKVVIALVIPHVTEADGHHNSYSTVGSGAMFVFQDGVVTKGTWQKASRSAQFVFTNEAGQTLKLNPGKTWLTMVSNAGAVSYKP